MNNENINKEEKEEIKQDNTNFLEELSNEIENLKEQLIREKAENENIRKRFKKELEDAHKFAISNFVKNLTEQVENLFRASESIDLKACENNNELKTLFEGIEITKKNLLKVFQDYEIQRIYPLDQNFDHKFHEAVSQVVDSKREPNTVVNVIQAGYSIRDRLLKPAIVIVTKKE
ncbi:nucleotide exchange factor GrpE [Candidatus Bandiella numerosa]|uniref:nucleotide exchange factor GrpE n=1 Tax=Candidatus Bandiella numerosa TaxID=2570586 RepID=UPI001F17DF95|nr:nucleotide exchange factor GrpE [Candidatus Bandiella numerosa]